MHDFWLDQRRKFGVERPVIISLSGHWLVFLKIARACGTCLEKNHFLNLVWCRYMSHFVSKLRVLTAATEIQESMRASCGLAAQCCRLRTGNLCQPRFFGRIWKVGYKMVPVQHMVNIDPPLWRLPLNMRRDTLTSLMKRIDHGTALTPKQFRPFGRLQKYH